MSIAEDAGIVVVIPTLNEGLTIEAVLRDLADGLPPRPVKFIVADGGSDDDTCAIVERLRRDRTDLHLLHNPKRLQGAGINLAVARFAADQDVLVRCDAHALYPPAFVNQLFETLQRVDADAIVVPMDSVGRTCFQKAVAWMSDTPIGSGGSAHRGGAKSGYIDHGHHAAFRVSSFRRAGGYDESFTHNEDAELDCRQRAMGGQIYLDAKIRLGYFPRDSLAGLWRQYFNYGRGRSRTVRRHPGSLRLRQFAVPFHIAVTAISLLAAFWNPVLLAWPLLYLLILSAAATTIALRHRSFCGFLAAPAALIMHTSWALGFLSGMIFVRQSRWTGPPMPAGLKPK